MTMSPGSRCGSSSSSSWSTTAAGTIIQIARGAFIFATSSASDAAPVAPSFASAATAAGLHVEDDALVAALLQPPHHVRAHPAESDHSELHRRSLR